jgi:DeoR family fructose operon transcriptional repressor
VRRVFTQLENEKRVIRTHGGIQLVTPGVFSYSYQSSEQQRSPQKDGIGKKAVHLIDNGESIFLDSGTTVAKLAFRLAYRLQSQLVHEIITVTNSINIAELLAPHCRVIFIGGEVRSKRRDVCGAISEKVIALFKLDIAFLGTDGIDSNHGLMTMDIQTANMYEALLQRSDKTYVLADTNKFDKPSFMTYAPLSAATAIITDDEIPPSLLEKYRKAGAKILKSD